MSWDLDLIGLILNFIGSLFLLTEGKLPYSKGNEIRIPVLSESSKGKQHLMRDIGIGLLTLGFFLQIVAIVTRS